MMNGQRAGWGGLAPSTKGFSSRRGFALQMSGSMRRKSVQKWGIIFLCWTAVGVFFASQSSLYAAWRGRTPDFLGSLPIYLSCAYSWFLLTPFILILARRFPLARPRVWRHVVLHSGVAVVFSFVSLLLVEWSQRLLFPQTLNFTVMEGWMRLVAEELHAGLLRYWAVVGIAHAIAYYTGLREREVTEASLRAQLAEARLEVLKRQLQPHFLFNTLNSISVLMFEDPKMANRMLTRLSDLLRTGLSNELPDEVSLEREIDFLGRYLDIERMRFGDRLTILMEVDAETLGASVPNLMLQPLVENAIKHGIGSLEGPSTITIRAAREGDELRLEVLDNGRGVASDARPGVGLSNTVARLRHLYGEHQRLQLIGPGEGGASVQIAIPFRAAAAPA
jgi:two-component system, LytTR family, sensor kinase